MFDQNHGQMKEIERLLIDPACLPGLSTAINLQAVA